MTIHQIIFVALGLVTMGQAPLAATLYLFRNHTGYTVRVTLDQPVRIDDEQRPGQEKYTRDFTIPAHKSIYLNTDHVILIGYAKVHADELGSTKDDDKYTLGFANTFDITTQADNHLVLDVSITDKGIKLPQGNIAKTPF